MEKLRTEIVEMISNEILPENEINFIYNYLKNQIKLNEYVNQREPKQQDLFEGV